MTRKAQKMHVIRNHTKASHQFHVMGEGVRERAVPKVDPDTGDLVRLDNGDYASEILRETYPKVVETLELSPTLKRSKPGLLEVPQDLADAIMSHPVYSQQIDAGWFSITPKTGA